MDLKQSICPEFVMVFFFNYWQMLAQKGPKLTNLKIGVLVYFLIRNSSLYLYDIQNFTCLS